MKLGIFAKTFAGSNPLAVLTQARDAGYSTVQYNMACSGLSALPETIDAATADALQHASQAAGIKIAAISATYNMAHPDLAVRQRGRQSFAAIAGAAKRLGTGLLTVCTGSRDAQDQWRHHPDNASPAALQDMLREFEALIAIADRHDILIGVEPELANVVNSAQQARRLVDELQSPRIKIVLDPANLCEVDTPERRAAIIAAAVDLLADRIALAHAKDRFADGGFAVAGDGVVDFGSFIAALRKIGFSGGLITHGLAASDAPRVAAFLRAKLQALDIGP